MDFSNGIHDDLTQKERDGVDKQNDNWKVREYPCSDCGTETPSYFLQAVKRGDYLADLCLDCYDKHKQAKDKQADTLRTLFEGLNITPNKD